jgi:hypothetical protein
MMRTKCIAVLIGVLILTSMANCGPGAPPAPGDTGIILPTLAPTTKPATVAEPTEPQRGTVVPISPSQIITENKAMNGPQVQPLLGDETTESIKLAKQDLAQRLGVSVDSLTVVGVIGQGFSTDAFYCRATKDRIAKDESPAAMSGWSILLSASGRRYEYHASGQMVIFCRPLP